MFMLLSFTYVSVPACMYTQACFMCMRIDMHISYIHRDRFLLGKSHMATSPDLMGHAGALAEQPSVF